MRTPTLSHVTHLRSVNLERDLQAPPNYIVTPQALQLIQRLVRGLATSPPAPRAYTITGPYGVGKSAFAAFLTQIACPALPRHRDSLQQLQAEAPVLVDDWRSVVGLERGGMLPLVCVGARMPLRRCLARGIATSLKTLHRYSHAIEKMIQCASEAETDEPTLELITTLYTLATNEWGYTGVLLIVDELGKLLEYQAYEGVGDLYLLQQIAEFACSTEPPGLNLIAILHQGFEAYLNRLDDLTRREWTKVQGRFEDIPFYEPPHHLLPLIARALHEIDLAPQPDAETAAAQALALGLCPRGVSETEFKQWCLHAHLLHPTVFIALPYLFRFWAQHERSLFAYLFSEEPFAVPDTIACSGGVPVRLHHLYDYIAYHIAGNWGTAPLTQPISLAQEMLVRFPDLLPLEVQVIKTVAVINILGEVCPVRSTLSHIAFALGEPESKVAEVLAPLLRKSVLTYRRYNQSYYLWEGSHIDIEERLQRYRARLAGGVVEQLTRVQPLPPLVAHRHSYHYGVLRYFEVRYCDLPSAVLPPRDDANSAGQILVCLPRNPAEHARLCEWAQSERFREAYDRVVVVTAPVPRLHELFCDYLAMNQMLSEDEELQQDATARKEVEVRLRELHLLVQEQLQRALGRTADPENAPLWFYRGQSLGKCAGRQTSQRLSAICDQIYHAAPILRNELIQRRQLSTSVAAARRNLIEAMLLRRHLPRLGIQGHPPELSLYRSLLEATQLHRLLPNGEWGFVPPDPQSDPARLRPVWEQLYRCIQDAFPEQVPLTQLIDALESPPFGVLPSVFPILLCAFWIVYQNELSLYREGRLVPEPTVADWELLLRRPDLFRIGGVRITDKEQAILDALSVPLATEPQVMTVVRALVRRLRNLPEYALRTSRLSQTSLALRLAVQNASSPERLIFHDLPKALSTDLSDPNAATHMAQRLQTALEELETAYPTLLQRARRALLQVVNLPDNDAGWAKLQQLCRDYKEQILHPTLKPLLYRIAAASDETNALESALAYISGRPPRAWGDLDEGRFAESLQGIAELIHTHLFVADPSLPPEKEQKVHHIAQQLYEKLRETAQTIDINLLRSIFRQMEQLHLTQQESESV